MTGRRSLLAIALMFAVFVAPLLAAPVFAQELPDCYIRILKEVEPSGSDLAFVFEYEWGAAGKLDTFELRDGEDEVFTLMGPGSLGVRELVPVGWPVPEVECSHNPEDSDVLYDTAQVVILVRDCDQVNCVFTNKEPPAETPPPPFVPEASTLILLGSAATTLAGYAGLKLRARRRR